MTGNFLLIYQAFLCLLFVINKSSSAEINGKLELNLKTFFYNSSYLPQPYSTCCILHTHPDSSCLNNCVVKIEYSYSYNSTANIIVDINKSFDIRPDKEQYVFTSAEQNIGQILGIDTIINFEITATLLINSSNPLSLLPSQQIMIHSVNKLNTIEVIKERDITKNNTTIRTLESKLTLTERLVCDQNYGGNSCNICLPHFNITTNCTVCEPNYNITTNCAVCNERFEGGNCIDCAAHFTGAECDRCEYGFVTELPEGDCSVSGVCYWDRWCAPGSCNSDYTSCTCNEGFANPPYCDQITTPPQFLSASLTLSTVDGSESAQLNEFFQHSNLTFTRYNTTRITYIEWSGVFNRMYAFSDGQEPMPSRTTHFDVIYNSSAYGIVDQYYVVQMRNSTGNLITEFNSTSFFNSNNRSVECRKGNSTFLATRSSPAQSEYSCSIKGATMLSVVPKHKDRFSVQVYLTSGGYINLERVNTVGYRHVEFFSLPSATISYKGQIEFDFEPPFNCFNTNPNPSNCSILTTDPMVTKSTHTILLSWSGYEDDASGLSSFRIQVFELTASNSTILSEGNNPIMHLTTELNASATNTQLTLPNDGIFSFIMEVEDDVGNPRYVRRIVLADLNSTIKIDQANAMNVPTAVSINGFNWQTNLDQNVTFNWTGHFYNTNLRTQPWLYPIDTYSIGRYRVDTDYDQINGYLNISGVNNIDGVVTFWYHSVSTNGSDIATAQIPNCEDTKATTWRVFNSFPDQVISLDINRYDGVQTYFWVLAQDYYNKTVCNYISVRYDSSPPQINILGIKYFDRNMNVVHNTLDLEEVNIEFTVADEHSGLKALLWELGTTGNSRDIGTGSITIEDCNPQDTDCVCTPNNTCYNAFYTLNFTAAQLNDSIIQHYQDIYLKITATNGAGLINSKDFYFFIDTTAPTRGIVIDNIAGEKDRDFSSTKELTFYWEGFNDPESYIDFYQYACTTRCLTRNEFAYPITNANPLVFSTDFRTANCIQVFPRRIFMTVVAFNYALLHSEPACSDGIIFDNTPPLVGNISFSNVTFIPGLVKENITEQLWVINSNGHRFRVDHNFEDFSCIESAPFVDVELYPISETDSPISISEACKTYPPFSKEGFQTVANFISVRWTGLDLESGILDYRIGLSSTGSNLNVPNLVPLKNIYLSTRFTSYPASLSNLQAFYVVIHGKNHANEITTIESLKIQVTVSKPNIRGDLVASKNRTYSTLRWAIDEIFSDTSISANSLTYEIAAGSLDDRTDLIPFYKIIPEICSDNTNYSCISFSLSKINDSIHSNFRFYTLLRVSNIFGFSTTASSNPLTLSFNSPTKGIIIEINQPATSETNCRLTMDIDYQIKNNSVAVCWLGFIHQFEMVTYRVGLGTSKYLVDIVNYTFVGSNTSFVFENLFLTDFQRYYVTVIAQNVNGEVNQTSDGLFIISRQASYTNAIAYAGYPQVSKYNSTIYYQLSSSSFLIEWNFDDVVEQFISYYQFSLLNCSAPTRKNCNTVGNKMNAGNTTYGQLTKLKLISGRYYFASVEACHAVYCFNPIYSNPVMIINKPPTNGSIITEYIRTSRNNRILTRWAGFNEITGEVIENYEWSYGMEENGMDLVVPWVATNTFNISGHYEYSFNLGQQELSALKNYFVTVQAYGRTGLRTMISASIKTREESNSVVIERYVYDVVQNSALELLRGESWTQSDRDYTEYNNRLQAVWPSYSDDYFFVSVNTEPKFDSCNPQCYCNITADVYITITGLTLVEGSQYFICIRSTELNTSESFGKSKMLACSDGIIVNVNSPTGGIVTIGQTDAPTIGYQSNNDVLVLNWIGFADIEKVSMFKRPGIADYKCGLGTSLGIDDVILFKSVGVNENCTFLNLTLKTSLVYYGTVIAIDHLGRETNRTSLPITIDQTPPTSGSIYVGTLTLFPNSPLTLQSSDIRVHWVGIVDDGSGVASYEWGVGSRPYLTDISSFLLTYTTNIQDIGVSHLIDGSTIHVTIKTTNHAGLYSLTTSQAITIDRTPPIASDIFDGTPNQGSTDIDYQTSFTTINAYWNAFTDPHSLFIIYQFGIGTCTNCTNTMPFTNIGTNTAARSPVLDLRKNVKYFVTVKGCNQANLCAQSVSDGIQIDDTPPKAGIVWDGIQGEDLDFQGQRYLISGRWFGFHDAESGISHYEWCIGTIQGICNLEPFESLHDSTYLYRTYNQSNNVLPTNGTRIFLMIRAWNYVGMEVNSASDGFIIDTSPPYFTKSPKIDISLGSFYSGYQIARNYLKIRWESFDPDTVISSHLITVYNTDELQEITSTFEGGSETSVVFTDLDLHDGITYFAVIVVCNLINLCSSTESDRVILDSTPPILGSFAFDHPQLILNINQTRNVTEMRWANYNNTSSLHLSWTGFYDLHTWIKSYHLTVGRKFYGWDLSGDTVVKLTPNLNPTNNVEVHNISLSGTLNGSNEAIYITLWAENNAGLYSSFLQQVFIAETPDIQSSLLQSGVLKLLRYDCQVITCDRQCACASPGASCSQNAACNCQTNGTFSPVILNDVIQLNRNFSSEDIHFTPFNSFFSLQWNASQPQDYIFYQISIALKGESPGSVVSDPIWYNSGQLTRFTLSLPRGVTLKPSMKYAVHLRAWLSTCSYTTFESSGIIVDLTAPTTSNLIHVREVISLSSDTDIDYQATNASLVLKWGGVFQDRDTSIHYYEVALGTKSFVQDLTNSFINTRTNETTFIFNSTNLIAGIRLYATVRAFDLLGLVAVETSDGIVIDTGRPIGGVVLDVNYQVGVDADYQSETTSMRAQWNNFVDLETGINYYEWSVGTSPYPSSSYRNIINGRNVGLNLRSTVTGLNLTSGVRYYSTITAVDIVGHRSIPVSSDGITIDNSPPIPLTCLDKVYTNNNIALIMSNFQVQVPTIPDTFYQIFICISHYTSDISQIPDEVLMQIIAPNLNVTINIFSHEFFNSLTCQSYYFNLKAVENTSVIGIINFHLSRNITLKEIYVSKCFPNNSNTIILHNQLSIIPNTIECSWFAYDPESRICSNMIAIGHTPHGQHILAYRHVGIVNNYLATNIEIYDGIPVYITVIVENCAGLRTVIMNESPMVFDTTGPILTGVRDGKGAEDIDYSNERIIWLSFDIPKENESHLECCEWAIGLSPGSDELQNFTRIPLQSPVWSENLTRLTQDDTVYSTLICTNDVGLSTIAHTDGVTFSIENPSIQNASLSVLTSQITPYSPIGAQMQNEFIALMWEGIRDVVPIVSHNITITNHFYNQINYTLVGEERYTNLFGLVELRDGANYTISLVAINIFGAKSDVLQTSIGIDLEDPRVNDPRFESFNTSLLISGRIVGKMHTKWTQNMIQLNWTGTFLSKFSSQLRYEFSISTQPDRYDLKQWVMSQTFHELDLTKTENLSNKINQFPTVVIILTAYSPSGRFTTVYSEKFYKEN